MGFVEVWNLKGQPGARGSLPGNPPGGKLSPRLSANLGGGPGSTSARSVFSPNNRFLLTGHADGGVRLWNLVKAEQFQGHTFAGILTPITSVAWSPDEKLVAAASDKGKVVVWDRETVNKVHEWQLAGPVHDVVFAPDGNHLLTANANGTVFVLRLKSSP